MMLKGTDVIGLNVFTVRDGRKLSAVKDIVYDPRQHKVLALIVDEGGWFSDATVIPIDQVKSIGDDAVLIDNEDVLMKADEVSEYVSSVAGSSTYLTKTRVLTDTGKDLGTVNDIYFDPTTGSVDELEVSQGVVGDISGGMKKVRVADIVTVGQDATIVKGYVEDSLEAQADQGGVQGLVQEGMQKAYEVKDHSKTQGFLNSVKQTIQDAENDIKEATNAGTNTMDEWRHDYHQKVAHAESWYGDEQPTTQSGKSEKHGGWYGDSKGHSKAAKKGHRR